MSRICVDCKVEKLGSEFYYGQRRCKNCSIDAAKSSYRRNKDRDPAAWNLRQRSYELRKMQENPARWRATRFFCQKRARDVSADVTIDLLTKMFERASACECCGDAIDICKTYEKNDRVPSVDRVDNNRAYTADNIAIICWKCNQRKGDMTVSDLRRMLAYIERYASSR